MVFWDFISGTRSSSIITAWIILFLISGLALSFALSPSSLLGRSEERPPDVGPPADSGEPPVNVVINVDELPKVLDIDVPEGVEVTWNVTPSSWTDDWLQPLILVLVPVLVGFIGAGIGFWWRTKHPPASPPTPPPPAPAPSPPAPTPPAPWPTPLGPAPAPTPPPATPPIPPGGPNPWGPPTPPVPTPSAPTPPGTPPTT